MNIEDIDCLLSKIRDTSGLDEFVVIGSLSALGAILFRYEVLVLADASGAAFRRDGER